MWTTSPLSDQSREWSVREHLQKALKQGCHRLLEASFIHQILTRSIDDLASCQAQILFAVQLEG